MGSMLDYIGSMIVAGGVSLLVLTLNANMTQTSFQRNLDMVSQQSAVKLTEILEHDLYKAGYRISGSVITRAESLALSFIADLNDDGRPDSIHYNVGSPSSLANSSNPNDRPFYRKVNGEQMVDVALGLVSFYFSYIDTANRVIPYTELTTQAKRDVIRMIRFSFRVEPADPIDTTNYVPVQVTKNILPKNIAGW
jgi:hypothetical protein